MDQSTIYVTGHKHPDTDSIASAIGYAFYKRANGTKAVPCRLGKLSSETQYLLDRFGFEKPMMLEDARVKLSEITLDEPLSLTADKTLREAIRLMEEKKKSICGVVDNKDRLIGIVTINTAAQISMSDTAGTAKLLVNVTIDDICEAIKGEVVYRAPVFRTNGKVSVVAMTEGSIEQFKVNGKIVILGDDAKAQREAIGLGAGVLILVRAKGVDDSVLKAAKEHNCSIILSGYSTMNTSRYIFFAPEVGQIMTENPIRFYEKELVEDVGRKMQKSRYHSYPVVDDSGRLKGYVSRYHIMNAENKKLIMVDHNEFSQSVRGIEKAEVLEVIDHHRINDFSSNRPVSFRNEIVGSSATIVSTIFKENRIPLPKHLAGLLLGAVLSDTLKFQSPTTTDRDREIAEFLAGISDVDIDELARNMFSVSADISGKTVPELLNQDIKFFDIDGCKTMISQVIVSSVDVARGMEKQVQPYLDEFVVKKDLDLVLMAFTSILDNGTVFYAAGARAPWALEAFPNKGGESRSLQEGVLSRKSQILPRLTAVVRKYA